MSTALRGISCYLREVNIASVLRLYFLYLCSIIIIIIIIGLLHCLDPRQLT